MSLLHALPIARRELRGGLAGFRVFLLCLLLGVAAIAGIGTVRAAIEAGLNGEASTLLGGDAEMHFTHRQATEAERTWLAENTLESSEVITFRSMLQARPDSDTTELGLSQVKAVDAAYPLYGSITLEPPMPLAEALAAEQDGLPGLVAHPALIDRLGISVGDTVRLGTQSFTLRAAIIAEPDGSISDLGLGPRVMVRSAALADSGLLTPGTLFESKYRMRLGPNPDLPALQADAESRFEGQGMRWRDSRNGAPGISEVVDRLSSFLVMVGLAGMAVGGVGVSAAVRAYLARKTDTIATLKSFGATRGTIFATYLLQIGALSLLGVGLGLLIGGGIPALLIPLLGEILPVPIETGIYPAPLLEAAIYGLLTALIFSIWPLARAVDISPAELFREVSGKGQHWPRWPYVILVLVLAALLIYLAMRFSGVPMITLWAAIGILAALATLALAATLTRALARRLARARMMRGRPALRLALGSIGGPGFEATSVVLSLGLGLTVLAAIGQIDTNLRTTISQDLPERAPAFFVLDIQKDQIKTFQAAMMADEAVEKVDSAPMLRGTITEINGVNARDVVGDHWVVSGDRGITYSATLPENSTLQAGEWWPEDYDGPPLMSFSAEEAAEIGVKIGDEITANILGRDMTAKIANLRDLTFSDMSINFVMVWSPNALQGAPHTFLSTVYATPGAEGRLLRIMAVDFPNITAIPVRDAIERVSATIDSLGAAIRWGAAATLLTGFVVLIGAAAAGAEARVFEAAVLKTLGASRGRILLSFALRSLILGAAAGLVALLAGSVAAWAVMEYVMSARFSLAWGPAIVIIFGGALANLVAGLGFAWPPLAKKPAQILRNRT
ncbi:MAG: FtsX-like permease family protein [Rhodobacteraceae bacterium]|nr:FtsX-like permease family protein [Paracoccaceae bacterium]